MKNIIYVLLSALLFVGCVTDDTVHDFKTLNAIKIEGLEDNYQFNYLETSTIEPEVNLDGQTEENIEYRWYMYTPTTRFVADTISKEKNMNSLINAIPGEEYTLVFSVKDLTTGIVYKKEMTADVLGQLTEGMMFLAETNGIVDVNFVRPDNSVLYNVYANANPGDNLAGLSHKIQFVNPSNFAPALKSVYVFSNDADGGFFLNPITFKKDNVLRDAFYATPPYATLNAEYYFASRFRDYLIINGKLFNRSVNLQDPIWKTEMVVTDPTIPNTYQLAPFILNDFSNSQSTPILFDDLHGRFLTNNPNNKGELVPFVSGGTAGFDYNNTGVKMLFNGLDIRITGDRGLRYYAVCEDATDASKRYMMKFFYGLGDNGLGLYANELNNLPSGDFPGLYAATSFVSDDLGIPGVVWYTDGKKLYAMNVSSTTPSEIIIRDFEAEGMTVDVLKMLRYSKDGALISELRLAVRNSNLSSGQAGIIYMTADITGGIHATETSNLFGLGDRIIDFDEKLN